MWVALALRWASLGYQILSSDNYAHAELVIRWREREGVGERERNLKYLELQKRKQKKKQLKVNHSASVCFCSFWHIFRCCTIVSFFYFPFSSRLHHSTFTHDHIPLLSSLLSSFLALPHLDYVTHRRKRRPRGGHSPPCSPVLQDPRSHPILSQRAAHPHRSVSCRHWTLILAKRTYFAIPSFPPNLLFALFLCLHTAFW